VICLSQRMRQPTLGQRANDWADCMLSCQCERQSNISTFYGIRWHLLATFPCLPLGAEADCDSRLAVPARLRRRLLDTREPTAAILNQSMRGRGRRQPSKWVLAVMAQHRPRPKPSISNIFLASFCTHPQLFLLLHYHREPQLLNHLASILDAGKSPCRYSLHISREGCLHGGHCSNYIYQLIGCA
jgi:hypothetical protein